MLNNIGLLSYSASRYQKTPRRPLCAPSPLPTARPNIHNSLDRYSFSLSFIRSFVLYLQRTHDFSLEPSSEALYIQI